ncbi:MAG: molybdate ABC transporter permease subunit [Acidimicrobiales bacterium]
MEGLIDPGSPLRVSLTVAVVATALGAVAAVGLAYALAKGRFRGRRLIETLASLPVVLPPTVLGYYLLVVLGQTTPLGRAWQSFFGEPLVFNLAACVLAGGLVGFPFCLRAARVAIADVDPALEEAARAAGLSEARVAVTVTLPLARRGIGAGVSMGMARALGDFGTTLMVGGAITGQTVTLPIAIYTQSQIASQAAAADLALVMVVLAAALLGLATWLGRPS